jgi:hypothetical protein
MPLITIRTLAISKDVPINSIIEVSCKKRPLFLVTFINVILTLIFQPCEVLISRSFY